MRVAILVVALGILAGTQAEATTPFVRQIECPVGGETFAFTDTASSSSWGQRPDGKPYSNWDYPLPVCPGNGLVVYREFSEAERARLPDILQSPQFAEIRAMGQPYYAASFIERALAPESSMATWLLLQASWRVDADPLLKARFLQEFILAAQAEPLDPANRESVVLRLRMANALRELGRFDEAETAFASIATVSLDGAAGFSAYVETLRRVNARRDSASEPLDAIPPRIAASQCLDREGEPGWDPGGLCQAEPLRAEVERIRGYRAR